MKVSLYIKWRRAFPYISNLGRESVMIDLQKSKVAVF